MKKAFIVTQPKGNTTAKETRDLEKALIKDGYTVVNMETIDPAAVSGEDLNRWILKALAVSQIVVRSNGWWGDKFCRTVVQTARDFRVPCESENRFIKIPVHNTVIRLNWFDRVCGDWFTNPMKMGGQSND